MKEINLNILVGYAVLLVIAVGTSVIGIYIASSIQKEQPPQVVIIKPEEKSYQFPDYEAYKSFSKKTILAEKQISFVTKDYEKIGEIKKSLSMKEKFRRAYVFIDISVDNGKPLTIYDSIYVLLNYKGGHILRNKSLPTPPSNTTQLLYDMREIPYITSIPYSENKQSLFTNWLDEIDSKENISFYAFLSSWRSGGFIKEITVAFECEENSECNIISK